MRRKRKRKRFELLSNKDLDNQISFRDKANLRLITVFKSVANILYKDTLKNPWKMFFYCGPVPGGGWTIGALTCAFYATGITESGRQHCKNFVNSLADPINYKLYSNFMQASDDGKVSVLFKPLKRHLKDQAKAHCYNNIEVQVRKMCDGRFKSRIEKRLRKRISKGELVLVA